MLSLIIGAACIARGFFDQKPVGLSPTASVVGDDDAADPRWCSRVYRIVTVAQRGLVDNDPDW
jgi:hypothetical protein